MQKGALLFQKCPPFFSDVTRVLIVVLVFRNCGRLNIIFCTHGHFESLNDRRYSTSMTGVIQSQWLLPFNINDSCHSTYWTVPDYFSLLSSRTFSSGSEQHSAITSGERFVFARKFLASSMAFCAEPSALPSSRS